MAVLTHFLSSNQKVQQRISMTLVCRFLVINKIIYILRCVICQQELTSLFYRHVSCMLKCVHQSIIKPTVVSQPRKSLLCEWARSLFPTTDILSRDLCHWSHCQSHRCHQHISSSDSSDHSKGKY